MNAEEIKNKIEALENVIKNLDSFYDCRDIQSDLQDKIDNLQGVLFSIECKEKTKSRVGKFFKRKSINHLEYAHIRCLNDDDNELIADIISYSNATYQHSISYEFTQLIHVTTEDFDLWDEITEDEFKKEVENTFDIVRANLGINNKEEKIS